MRRRRPLLCRIRRIRHRNRTRARQSQRLPLSRLRSNKVHRSLLRSSTARLKLRLNKAKDGSSSVIEFCGLIWGNQQPSLGGGLGDVQAACPLWGGGRVSFVTRCSETI